jgi:hypothetical protein
MDLMALAEGSEKQGTKQRFSSQRLFGGGAPSSSSTTSSGGDLMAKAASSLDPSAGEALRKLEELQLAQPKPKQPAAAAATATASSKSIADSPTASSPLQPPAPAEDPERPGANDWVCRTCSKGRDESYGDCTVPGSFRFCPTCGQSSLGVATIHDAPELAPTDDWDCQGCSEFCSASFLFCVECGLPAGSPPPPPPDECGGCGEALGDSFKFCPDCGTRRGTVNKNAKAMPVDEDATDWVCAKCNDDLPGSFGACPECGTRRAA